MASISSRRSSPARKETGTTTDSSSSPAPPRPISPSPRHDILASLALHFDTAILPSPALPSPLPRPTSVSPSTLAPPALVKASSPGTSPSRQPLLRSSTEPADVHRHPSTSKRGPQPRSATASINNEGRKSRRTSGWMNGAVAAENAAGAAPAASQTAQSRLVLEKLTLYESTHKFYVIASNQADSRYRVLKIDRTAPPPLPDKPGDSDHDDDETANGLLVTEDATIYSKDEIQQLLETLSAGNAGGITRVEDLFYGIAGFVRFTSTYYMILIKKRAPVALIGGHYIYHCEETILKPITPPSGTKNAEEARKLAAFQGVDLSKNFYFSYTYDLTHTLQYNLTRGGIPKKGPTNAFSSFDDKWVWNRHLLRPAFRGLKSKSPWVLPLIHGFVDQAKLSIFGRTVYITVIARRSRHFAGARFLKRGINDQGYVANDVETEQIVSDALTTPFHSPAPPSRRPTPGESTPERYPCPRFTSFVQVRGSIPLYWSQESINLSPKPPIELTVIDPYFSAAALHFDDLFGRYGGPVSILNLIKHKERAPRESKLLPEFKECIDYLNQFLPDDKEIIYIPWDIAASNKQRETDVIGILEDIAEESLEQTNFFHSGPEPSWYAINSTEDTPPYRSTPLVQQGVVRTNCIDCLDRTNAAQFVIAKVALGHQLHALGVIHDPRLSFDSDAVNLITEMYHDHGDTVALQYGGSHLVNNVETYRKIYQWSSHSRDMIENLKRFYANSFVDADKQAAIDLFLGIESATTPLPSVVPAVPRPPRRSYRDWFTPEYLEVVTPDEAVRRLEVTIAEDEDCTGNYWQAYYRPRLFTELARHFSYKMNSTLKYRPVGQQDGPDSSPFVPRLAAPHPKLNVVGGGVRRWMSQRAHTKATLHARATQRIEEAAPVPAPPITTTETIVARLLNPAVEPDEAREYASWVGQFEHLSLSQDLSEKDSMLYNSTASIGGPDGVTLTIDKASLQMYSDAVGQLGAAMVD